MRHRLKHVAVYAFVLLLGMSSLVWADSASKYMDDAAITAKVKAALLADSQLESLSINVETDQGTVDLKGTVDNRDQEAQAVKVASQVNGVKAVKNHLGVKGEQER